VRRTILILTCSFAPCPALAASRQGALAVRVRDPQRAPVADARVTVFSRSGLPVAAAATARDGSCRLRALPLGESLVTVEADSFSRFGPRRVSIEPDASIDLEVDLVLGGIREEVVVTAVDSAQPAGEVSKSLTVVGRREMDARGDVVLADVLGSMPGLCVQQLGAAGSATSVRTRGMRAQDTAVLIDGARFRDPSGAQGDSTDFLGDLAVTGLDRVEVLRGSGSSLYGSHAIGGVINLLSANGGGRPTGDLLLESGSLGLFHGRAHAACGSWGDRLTGSLGLSRFARPDGLDPHDAADNTSVQSRWVCASRRTRASSHASMRPRPPPTSTRRPPPSEYPDGSSRRSRPPTSSPPRTIRQPARVSFRSLLCVSSSGPRRLGYSVSYQRLATKRIFFEGRSASPDSSRPRSRARSIADHRHLTARADLSSAATMSSLPATS
jgi:outer membrane receptor protein involved in Fe transport